MVLLEKVKPEIVAFREAIITVSLRLAARSLQRVPSPSDRRLWLQVSSWIQHLIPKIEDGNDFGVAIQVSISRPEHRLGLYTHFKL